MLKIKNYKRFGSDVFGNLLNCFDKKNNIYFLIFIYLLKNKNYKFKNKKLFSYKIKNYLNFSSYKKKKSNFKFLFLEKQKFKITFLFKKEEKLRKLVSYINKSRGNGLNNLMHMFFFRLDVFILNLKIFDNLDLIRSIIRFGAVLVNDKVIKNPSEFLFVNDCISFDFLMIDFLKSKILKNILVFKKLYYLTNYIFISYLNFSLVLLNSNFFFSNKKKLLFNNILGYYKSN